MSAPNSALVGCVLITLVYGVARVALACPMFVPLVWVPVSRVTVYEYKIQIGFQLRIETRAASVHTVVRTA